MNYILLFFSILFETFKNSYTNHFGKKHLKTNADTCLFNMVLCVGSMIFCALMGDIFRVSPFTLALAVAFSLATAFSQLFLLLSMSCGPMSFSVLFSYLGNMIIPPLYSVLFLNQNIHFFQVIGFIFMLLSVTLGVDLKREDSQMTKKWLALTFSGFMMWGLVGVFQQVHQQSAYKSEIKGFLFWAFALATALFCIFYLLSRQKGGTTHYRICSKSTLFVLLAGLATGAINLINLYLAGVMPGIIFFPIASGGVILLSSLAALLIFRERLGTKQTISLISGILSVLLLSL